MLKQTFGVDIDQIESNLGNKIQIGFFFGKIKLKTEFLR